MVERLRSEIDVIERHIDFLWDDKTQDVEERGKLINSLAKKRFSLECQVQDLILSKLLFS